MSGDVAAQEKARTRLAARVSEINPVLMRLAWICLSSLIVVHCVSINRR